MTGISKRSNQDWYEIRLLGHLDPRWSAWFDGMQLAPQGDGTTVVRGPVLDQASLHGVLARIRDLGLPLLSVTQVEAVKPQHPIHRNNPNGD